MAEFQEILYERLLQRHEEHFTAVVIENHAARARQQFCPARFRGGFIARRGKDTAIQHTASTHFRNDAPRNLRIRCETDMIIPFRNGGQHPTLQFSFILNRIYRHMESMAVPLTYFVTVLLLSLLTSAGDMGATCPSLHPTLALPLWSKTARFPLFPPYA